MRMFLSTLVEIAVLVGAATLHARVASFWWSLLITLITVVWFSYLTAIDLKPSWI